MKKIALVLFIKIFLFAPPSYATLIELDGSNNAAPNIIDQSYNNQSENILNSLGEYGKDPVEIIVNEGVTFNNNNKTEYGEAFFELYNSSIKFMGNNKFSNNDTISLLFNSIYSSVSFGDNIEFSNNKTLNGFISMHTPLSAAYFGNNISFINNTVMYGGYGGMIDVYYYFDDVYFGNNLLFDNNTITGVYGGGIIATTLSNANFYFGNNTVFSNNKIFSEGEISGGIIKVDNNSVFNFNGTTKFINNTITVENTSEKYIYGNAVYLDNATMNFNLTEKGQYVLFQDNASYFNNPITGKLETELNSFYIYDQGNLNFNLTQGSYADIRDPIKSEVFWSSPEINKTGKGSLYLWGDNSEYYANINITEGSFYAMYDKNSPWLQRQNFSLDNAKITFENGSLFRPMMNEEHNKLAQLTGSKDNLTVNGTVFLAPYELSKLDVGNYTFSNEYSEFSGWNSDLAELIINGNESVELNIKSDLDGYKDLTSFADIYRKRSDLSLSEREILDNLYMTGELTDDLRDILGVLEGSDVINFENAHRGSIRQFNRQIYSRVNNKNCRECGVKKGYRDEHLWFNTGYNWITKSSSSKSAGYTYNPTSFAIGYDFDMIPRNLNTGIAFGYSTGEVKSSSGTVRSTNNVDEYLVSIYSKYKPKKAFINASVGGGIITNDTRLVSSTANTAGKYDSKVFFSNMDLGYDFGKYTETIEPYVGVDYTHIKANKLKEKGIGARHFDEIEWNIVETPIGVRYSKDIYTDNNIITPAIDVAFAYNFGDTKAQTNAYFAGNQGNKWKVVSSSEDRESFRGNINLKVNNLNMPFALNFGYAVDLRSDYRDNQLYATIRYDF